jgi:hypothetical protein
MRKSIGRLERICNPGTLIAVLKEDTKSIGFFADITDLQLSSVACVDNLQSVDIDCLVFWVFFFYGA